MTKGFATALESDNPFRTSRDEATRTVAAHLRRLAVQCTACRQLAVPSLSGGNQYQCVACRQEQTGPRHDIRLRLYGELMACSAALNRALLAKIHPAVEATHVAALQRLRSPAD